MKSKKKVSKKEKSDAGLCVIPIAADCRECHFRTSDSYCQLELREIKIAAKTKKPRWCTLTGFVMENED